MDLCGPAVQECRAKAAEEMTQARRRLEASAAEEDILRQRAEQQAADIASQSNIIKDLQSDVCRASHNAKVGQLWTQPCGVQHFHVCQEAVMYMPDAGANSVHTS